MKRSAMVLAAVLVGVAAGCGGDPSKARAERMAKVELSIYPLSSEVKCVAAPANGSAHRWACSAEATGNGLVQKVAVLIQCVDGAAVCTRVS